MTAPLFQQVQIATNSNAVSSITLSSLAVGSGSNRSLIALFGWRDDTTAAPPTGSSVVFNTSENFTYKGRQNFNFGGDNYCTIEVWQLDNPTNTTANVVATASEVNDSGDGMFLIVIELTSANNGSGTFGTGQSLDNAPTATMMTGAADSLVIWGIIGQAGVATSFTPGTGTTERADGNIGEVAYFAGEEAASGGSDTFDASWSISSRWAVVALEVKAAATGDASPTANDSSALTDSSALAAAIPGTDDGSLADAAALAVDTPGIDSATLTETAVITAVIAASDAGALTETAPITAELTSSDDGALSDAAVLDTSTLVDVNDSATLTETAVLTAAISANDAGVSTDIAGLDAVLIGSDALALNDVSALDMGAVVYVESVAVVVPTAMAVGIVTPKSTSEAAEVPASTI